jgi:hypothetical protein
MGRDKAFRLTLRRLECRKTGMFPAAIRTESRFPLFLDLSRAVHRFFETPTRSISLF